MSDSRPAILFLGENRNLLSVATLQALIATGRYQVSVGIDHPGLSLIASVRRQVRRFGSMAFAVRAMRRLSLIVQRKATLKHLAQEHKLVVFPVTIRKDRPHLELRGGCPYDLILVANFSQRLSVAWISSSRLGALNLHPSLLPAYRGPVPWYWMVRNGERRGGVTLHWMDENFDTGDIVAQRSFEIPRGATEKTLCQLSLDHMRLMLAETIDLVIRGTAPRYEQDEALASSFSFPREGTRG